MSDMRSQPAVDTLQISFEDWHALLSKLEDESKSLSTDERRSHERHIYKNILGLILEMPDMQGQPCNFLIKSRNISQYGLSFLHGQAIPEGCQCIVTLVKSNLSQARCQATIAHSRQIEDSVHEIGIKFDQPIDLSLYITPMNPAVTR